ncbi:Fructose-2,6-bisphosphatase [Borealophlyctis nickersoniae]|nr:Fructose-2,6-bisphosphatase [Borealophlyctis nickersoniae]
MAGQTEALPSSTKLACIMVGLPARGKTYVARKVARYLAWLGHHSRIFNVGNYRRYAAGAAQPHDFFDADHPANAQRRLQVAMAALDDMIRWFDDAGTGRPPPHCSDGPEMESKRKANGGGSAGGGKAGPGWVALYDATNGTRERRQMIYERLAEKGIQVMLIESLCTDQDIIMANIKEVKISSPDYVGVDPEAAVQDFIQRIAHYEQTYQTLSPDEFESSIPYVKLINVGDQVIVNKVRGYLQSRIVYFLMNLNITPRSFYFLRHGESLYNVAGRIGGDSDLSPRGRLFAQKMPQLVKETLGGNTRLTVWTSTLKRTIQTASGLEWPQVQWKQLDELDSGVCDGMTYEEIEAKYPEDFRERDDDKFNYRYRSGESYRDLVQRLEPVILELERHHERDHSILIVGHQAVLRAIYGYFLNYSHEELPYLKIPLHAVVKLTPKAYGCLEERFAVDVPAVDTHRPRGSNFPMSSPVGMALPDDKSTKEGARPPLFRSPSAVEAEETYGSSPRVGRRGE